MPFISSLKSAQKCHYFILLTYSNCTGVVTEIFIVIQSSINQLIVIDPHIISKADVLALITYKLIAKTTELGDWLLFSK